MSQDVALYDDGDDDGFSGSLVGGRLIRGAIIRFNETKGWTDRDGLRPPEELLVVACAEAVQRWKDKKPAETITVKPLPDVEALNETIPVEEWELGLDGKPQPPYKHQYIVYLIDPATASFYTFINSTTGARIAFEHLQERVITMRALRNARVSPLVKLSHAPMKTFIRMMHRPEFKILCWHSLKGGGAPTISGPTEPPQIDGGGGSAPSEPTTALQIEGKAEPSSPSAAEQTLSMMDNVSVPSVGEEMRDEIPW